MDVYVLNALSTLLSSSIVAFIAITYSRRRRTKKNFGFCYKFNWFFHRPAYEFLVQYKPA